MSKADQPDESVPAKQPDERIALGRRRLLHGGLAAGPVLMTLASRPVLAATCTSPSGYVSLNASTAGRGEACTGHDAAYWASHTQQWVGYTATGGQATRFAGQLGVFATAPTFFTTTTPVHPIGIGNLTLLDVLSGAATTQNASTDAVARAVGAAALNISAGQVGQPPVISLALIRDIWAEYGLTGYGAGGTFSPQSGATWNVSEILDYLSTTLGA